MGHRQPPSAGEDDRPRPQSGARQEPSVLRTEAGWVERAGGSMTIPHISGVITADEVRATADSIVALQLPNGMIPWYAGGHCDPWNHVETAMALDVAGLHDEAVHAYRWLARMQRSDGSWHNYYLATSIEDEKLDTNVVAYVATGVWHH